MLDHLLSIVAPDIDKKQLSWACEIEQLGPFLDFIGNLDGDNILTEEEEQLYVRMYPLLPLPFLIYFILEMSG